MLGIYLLLFAALGNAATITRRAVYARETSLASDLIGYDISSNTVETWKCRASSAWQTIGTVGKCCSVDGSDCFMATTCISGSVMANGDFSSTCTGTAAQTSCVTGTIYQSIGDQSPIMNYQCWPQWNEGNWKATRITTTPSSTPASSTSTSAPASSSITSSLPAQTSGAEESNSGGGGGSKSKAWIAGPVIGALLGAIFFTHFGIWLYRRRLRASQPHDGALEKDAVPLAMGSGSGQGESVRYAHMGGDGVVKEGGLNVRVAGEGQELANQQVHELGGNGTGAGFGNAPVEADGRAVGK